MYAETQAAELEHKLQLEANAVSSINLSRISADMTDRQRIITSAIEILVVNHGHHSFDIGSTKTGLSGMCFCLL
jgi:hypothetical protein